MNVPWYQTEHPPGLGFDQEPKLSQGCGKAMVRETATIIKIPLFMALAPRVECPIHHPCNTQL